MSCPLFLCRRAKQRSTYLLVFWIFLVSRLSGRTALSRCALIIAMRTFNSFSFATFSNWSRLSTTRKKLTGKALLIITNVVDDRAWNRVFIYFQFIGHVLSLRTIKRFSIFWDKNRSTLYLLLTKRVVSLK